MKLILNLLRGLAVIYWVAAISLFATLTFAPEAFQGAFDQSSSTSITEISSSEEITSSEEIVSSSLEELSSSEEILSSSEEVTTSDETISSSSEEIATSSEEVTNSLPESQPLRQAEICTLQCIDDPLTEEEECLSACDFSVEWFGYDIPTEMPEEPVHGDMYIVIDNNDDLFYSAFVFVVSTDLNEAGEEIVVSEWVEVLVPIGQTEGYDFYYDAELGQIFILELVETGGPGPLPEENTSEELTYEEFVLALEEFLLYSAIIMLPLTIIFFSIGSKVDKATSGETPAVAEEKTEEPKEKIKTRAIGVTRLRVRK